MPEKSDYTFKLEMSDYSKRRSLLMRRGRAPKISEAKLNLGEIASKVLFEQCDEALRPDMGLAKPLKGPGDTLWISPSDVLLNKVALKPPLTPKCMQALTHKGILGNQKFCEQSQKNINERLWSSHVRTNLHKEKSSASISADGVQVISSAFKERIISYKIPSFEFSVEPEEFLHRNLPKITKLLQYEIEKNVCIKMNIELFGLYFNPTTQTHDVKSFNTSFKIVCSSSTLTSILEEMFNTIASKIDQMAERDSELGESLENRFREEIESENQRALLRYRNELLEELEDIMNRDIVDVEVRERYACQMELEKREQQFEMTLLKDLDELEEQLRKEYERTMTNRASLLQEAWSKKMEEEVAKTVESMTKHYLMELKTQEERLTNIFQMELKKMEVLRDFDAKMQKRKTFEALRQLKHNLECTNLVNMMYVLCNERNKCCKQKKALENHYKIDLQRLEILVRQKDVELAKIRAEKRQQVQEMTIKEQCLRDVIKHFQKFIYFALKSAPAQAEFLLSLDKMMAFELANQVAKLDGKGRQEAPNIFTWPYEDKSAPSLGGSNLEILDNHDCFNELDPPIELCESDVLPAIYFQNKAYIREDFRDMLSAGIRMSRSHELWNPEVGSLMEQWQQKQQQEEEQEEQEEEAKRPTISTTGTTSISGTWLEIPLKRKSDCIKAHSERNMEINSPSYGEPEWSDHHSTSRRSMKSIVQFHEDPVIDAAIAMGSRAVVPATSRENNIRSSILANKSKLHQSSLKASSYAIIPEAVSEHDVPDVNSELLATKDSLELLKEDIIKSKTDVLNDLEKEVTDGGTVISEGQGGELETPRDSEEISHVGVTILEGRGPELPSRRGSGASNTFPLPSALKSDRELVTETKDSVIGRMVEMQQRMTVDAFSDNLKDSIYITREMLEERELYDNKKRKSSKLTSARNSLELLRMSQQDYVSEPLMVCQKRESRRSRGFTGNCCDKCHRHDVTQSHKSQDSALRKSLSKTDASSHGVRSIKMSAIRLADFNNDEPRHATSRVSFSDKPIFLQVPQPSEKTIVSSSSSQTKSPSYRSKKTTASKKTTSQRKESMKGHVKIVGDMESKEGDQDSTIFTAERIHSLVRLMSDQPYLIQLFTSGIR